VISPSLVVTPVTRFEPIGTGIGGNTHIMSMIYAGFRVLYKGDGDSDSPTGITQERSQCPEDRILAH
jgi:hypothetical protein